MEPEFGNDFPLLVLRKHVPWLESFHVNAVQPFVRAQMAQHPIGSMLARLPILAPRNITFFCKLEEHVDTLETAAWETVAPSTPTQTNRSLAICIVSVRETWRMNTANASMHAKSSTL